MVIFHSYVSYVNVFQRVMLKLHLLLDDLAVHVRAPDMASFKPWRLDGKIASGNDCYIAIENNHRQCRFYH